jgi:D-alanyl-D-alanine carboxypeptidase (penicillin-binding protein 5/6)
LFAAVSKHACCRLLLSAAALSFLPACDDVSPAAGAEEQPSASRPRIERCLLAPLDMKPLPCESAVLVEAQTGVVLYAQNPDTPRPPASLVKMLLQLVVFERIDAGEIAITDSVAASRHASTMGGSQVFLKQGEVQPLKALLQAIAICSANDAAVAVAEHLAGTEEACVALLNERARQLGCTGTVLANVHGLDLRGSPRNRSTARDLARIGRALVDHPLALELAGTRRAPFRGGEFWLDTTNLLLGKYEGLDGLKTGYTPRAGGCFCGTVEREGVRFVSVVLGAPPGRARFELTRSLLERVFARRPSWFEVVRAGSRLDMLGPLPVQHAGGRQVWPVADAGARVLLEAQRRAALDQRIRTETELAAPLFAGERIGYLDCRLEGKTVVTIPVVAAADVGRVPPAPPAARRPAP